MTAKTMQEVLAEHENSPVIRRGEGYTRCSCGFLSKGAYSRASHNRHVSDALSAAGFGLVADAKAEALAAIHTVPPISHGIDADARFANGYNEALRRVRAAVAAAKGDGE